MYLDGCYTVVGRMQMVPVSMQNPSNQIVMMYPGNPGMHHHHGSCHHHRHKCKKHKKKKDDSDSDSDSETELVVVQGGPGQQNGSRPACKLVYCFCLGFCLFNTSQEIG